jgi:cation diffusion facilitator CzcD-associated flavoprotein CzcO
LGLRASKPPGDIDIRTREVVLAGGDKVPYDRLLLATGAEPVRLPIPEADQPHVRTLRSLADCHAIIEFAKTARRVLVIGRASSALRSLPHCARAGSRSTSWRRKSGRWSEFWGRRWATSFVLCTRNTAQSFTSMTRQPPSMANG